MLRLSAKVQRLSFALASVAIVPLVACNNENLARPGLPAAVTIVLGDSATDLNALRAQIAVFDTGQTHIRKRKVEGCECGANVAIQSVGVTLDIKPDSGPAVPRLVAHIVNRDSANRPTEKPRFRPMSEAQYYVQVYRDAFTHAAKWRMLEVPTAAHGLVAVTDSGSVHGCGHAAAATSDADFRDCDGWHPHYTARATGAKFASLTETTSLTGVMAFVRSMFRPAAGTEDPTWISCSLGCCTLLFAD